MRACLACGTAGQAAGAAFCFGCGSALTAPGCRSCGGDLPPGARFCPTCGASSGTAEPPTGDAARSHGTARKITSVLFGDLVGFTSLSESRDPEEVRELLTAYFEECRAIVSRYGGELEKFIGDAVMAVWGLPVTREDDAERAVRAGIELVEGVAALGDRIGMPGLALRVGITTAEVAVTLGATGQGMVAGDPVNTAARIQSAAEPGQVWVDETTRAFTTSSIAYDDTGAHAMKGKADPVSLWAVRAVVAGSGGDLRDDGLEPQLRGRDRELRLIKEVFHSVEETSRPGLLIVDGEAGVGKSRLGWEFEKYVDGLDADVLWHRGRCLSYGEGVVFFALAEAVRGRIAALGDGDEASDNRTLLQRALNSWVPEIAEREWLGPRLSALLGLEVGGSFAREDLFVAWTAFFKYVGLSGSGSRTARPVVLLLDDAQYADAALISFLEHLLAAADYPVFVLVFARPEMLTAHPDLVGNRRVTVVHLEALVASDMTRLLNDLVTGVPAPLLAELVARAEGIPLFAIETVRSMVDQDLVVNRDGRLVLADPSSVDLAALTAPATLQALIAARLDALPVPERRIIDRACVLGLVFTHSGIAALCPDVPELDLALEALIRRQVLRRDTDRLSADFGNLRFVQGAVRQVASGMLSRRDRKATHLMVARALEVELEVRSDASDELAPVIAQHYLDALDAVPGDPDVPDLSRAASDHLVRAADLAASLGAPAAAASHLARALSRCEPENRLALQSRLAHQLLRCGDHEAAIKHAADALAGYETTGDVVLASGPAEDLAMALVYSEGDLERADAVVRTQLDRLPDTAENLAARIALVTASAAVMLRLGRTDELQRIAAESMRLAERSGAPQQIADSWITYGITWMGTLPHLSRTLLEGAAQLAGEHRALRVRGIALVNLSSSCITDDVGAAVRFGREAMAAGRELGEEYMAAFAGANLAFALLLAGEWDAAAEIASTEAVAGFLTVESDIVLRILTAARSGPPPPAVSDVIDQDPANSEDQSWVAVHELDRALEALEAGRPEASALALDCVGHDLPSAQEVWMNWLFASEIPLARGDRAAVRTMLDTIDAQPGPSPTGLAAQRARLEGFLGRGDSTEVESTYLLGLEHARAWGSALHEAHLSAELGAWLTGQGRAAEADEHLARARVFYDHVGARRWIEEMERR